MLATQMTTPTLRLFGLFAGPDRTAERQARLVELQEQAEAIVARVDAARRDFTTEEGQQFDDIYTEFNTIADELNIRKKVAANSELLSRPQGRRSQPDMPGAGISPGASSFGHQSSRPELPGPRVMGYKADGQPLYAFTNKQKLADYVRAETETGVQADDVSVGRWLRGRLLGDWQGAEAEKELNFKAQMSGGDDLTGGFLVPGQIGLRVLDRAREIARTIQAGMEVVPLDSAAGFVAKISKDPTVEWRPENTKVTSSEPNFARINVIPKTIASIVTTSLELAEDVANLSTVVEEIMAAAIANSWDSKVLYGIGTTEPAGLTSPVWGGVQSIASVGAIADYVELSQAVQQVAEANGPVEGLAAILNPRESGVLDRLTDSTGQPLQPSRWVAALQMLPTMQVSVTEGGGSNEGKIFVGDWSKCTSFVRTRLTLQASQEAGESFEKLQVMLRAYMRLDVVFLQDDHFVILDGITP